MNQNWSSRIKALFVTFGILCGIPLAHSQTNIAGSAVNLDGVNDYVQLPSATWFNGPFTIEGWVYARSHNLWSRLFDFGNGEFNHNVYLALTFADSGNPAFSVLTNGNGSGIQSTQQLPLNQWAHLAASYDGTNGAVYINGISVTNGPMNGPQNVVRTNNYFGRSNWAGDAYANGMLDEFRIWNSARNPLQLQTYMNQSLLGPQTNLVGYWRFDENTGTNTVDRSTNNRSGTLAGGVTWTNAAAPITNGFGTAFNFTTNEGVSIPHSPALNAYPLTVMTWFKSQPGNLSGDLVNKNHSTQNGWRLFFFGGRLIGWYFVNASTNAHGFGALDAGFVNDGLWHHAAMVVDAAGGRLYLDGALKAATPWIGTPGAPVNTTPVTLGANPVESFSRGTMDEASIWNIALTEAQIRSNALQSLVGNEPGLLAYYRLDEGGGTFVADSSTNQRNGSLMTNVTWVPSMPFPSYTAKTIGASNISFTGAELYGSVQTLGRNSKAWFQYGLTTNYTHTTPSVELTNGVITEIFNNTLLADLTKNATYHFRMVASNSVGMRFGTNQTFETGRIVTITNLADNGPGTLRQAIATAQNLDFIRIPGGTIILTNGQLAMTNPVTLFIAGLSASNSSISGSNLSRIFYITNATVTLSNLTLRDGQATPADRDGGAIYNAGTLTVRFCEIVDSRAGRGPNGPNSVSAFPGGRGGGIYNFTFLTVFGCTFVGNSAGNGGDGGASASSGFGLGTNPGNGGVGGSGGAIYNSDIGQAHIVNCTFATNAAGAGGHAGPQLYIGNGANGGNAGNGGAIFNSGILIPQALTIVGNSCGAGGNAAGGQFGSPVSGTHGGGGGIYNDVLADLAVPVNCIIAGNSIIIETNGPDVFGTFTSEGHNLIGHTNRATGFVNGINGDIAEANEAPVDPALHTLGYYGGPTRTIPLLPNSPALEAGNNAILSPPYDIATDQRGFPRGFNMYVDIGAYETHVIWPPTTAMTLAPVINQEMIFGTWTATFRGLVNPGGNSTIVYFQFGLTTNYGGVMDVGTIPALITTNVFVSADLTNLVDSRTYHYRVVASNVFGIVNGFDNVFSTPSTATPGDIDGNGVVDTAELAHVITNLHGTGVITEADLSLVLSNYWPYSPWIKMTNVAGLGGTNVTFAITNPTATSFTVEYSTNLSNWFQLGPAIPRFLFTDTNAPAVPTRHYRLRWP
jgi:hypothetical protein